VQVNVMIVENRQSGFEFHVDNLLSDVILQVSTDLGLLTDVSIRNKQGMIYFYLFLFKQLFAVIKIQNTVYKNSRKTLRLIKSITQASIT